MSKTYSILDIKADDSYAACKRLNRMKFKANERVVQLVSVCQLRNGKIAYEALIETEHKAKP